MPCNSKVCKFCVALFVEDYVFWLDVSVDNSLLVHIFKGLQKTCDDEPGLLLVEDLEGQMVSEVPARAKVHQHVQVLSVLESSLHVNNESIVELEKKVTYGWLI